MSNGGVAGALVAAAVARRRREIMASFRTAGATAPERAIPESAVSSRGYVPFAVMKKKGVIKETGDGKLWLDEAAAETDAAARRRIAAGVIFLAAVGIAIAFLLNKSGG